MELPAHPFFLGVQFHPELKSRPRRPHPLFKAFVHAAVEHQEMMREEAPDENPEAAASSLELDTAASEGQA